MKRLVLFKTQNKTISYNSTRFVKKYRRYTYETRKKFFESVIQKTFDVEINLKEVIIRKLQQSNN